MIKKHKHKMLRFPGLARSETSKNDFGDHYSRRWFGLQVVALHTPTIS